MLIKELDKNGDNITQSANHSRIANGSSTKNESENTKENEKIAISKMS